jgi:hypothetical protein
MAIIEAERFPTISEASFVMRKKGAQMVTLLL